jgi:hypothetical protein
MMERRRWERGINKDNERKNPFLLNYTKPNLNLLPSSPNTKRSSSISGLFSTISFL